MVASTTSSPSQRPTGASRGSFVSTTRAVVTSTLVIDARSNTVCAGAFPPEKTWLPSKMISARARGKIPSATPRANNASRPRVTR